MNAPDWTKDELMAYILLYAAHSDFEEHDTERQLILSKVNLPTYQKIHEEFTADNDFQSIQKIIISVEKHQYNLSDLDQILLDIKTLFFADGDFDVREHSMLLFLKRLFK